MRKNIYELYDNGKIVGKYNITQLSEMLGKKPKTLRGGYIYQCKPVDGRYLSRLPGMCQRRSRQIYWMNGTRSE